MKAIFCLLILTVMPLTATAQYSSGELEVIANGLREETGAPAISVLVMGDGIVQGEATVGVRSTSSDVLAENGDLWHVGSITKSMTATLAARLVQRGDLDWDMSVEAALGNQIDDIHPDFAPVTFRELFTHTSGLAPNISRLKFASYARTNPDARNERLDYARYMLSRAPTGTPGETFAYSNAGYIIAGAMMEQHLDRRWEDLIADHVFEPLGLESAGFGATGSADQLDQPRGHRPVFLAFGHRPVSPANGRADNPEVLGPAGRVHMTLEDLALYASAHVTGETSGGDDFLSDENLQLLHTPRLDRYAMGWVVQEDGSRPGMLWHNGSNTLNYAEVYSDPVSGLVIAMAANSHNARALSLAFRDAARSLYAQLDD
ncbi:MAG: serine hydrolase domain-containing protein [Pseudomonadota bacterium]